MTAPSGPILFNSSTGSDTAASGLGPATALTGAGASTTAASVTVTGIDTTGVIAGDLLWVSSSSGRQFSIIATIVGPTEVTCDDTFANTEASRTWAIGGKRATLVGSTSIVSTTGAKPGWIIQFEANELNFAAAITFACSGDVTTGPIIFRSDSSTKRTLQSSNAGNINELFLISGSYIEFRDLNLNHGAAANLIRGTISRSTGNNPVFRRCSFTRTGAGTLARHFNSEANTTTLEASFYDCSFSGTVTAAFVERGNTGSEIVPGLHIENCVFDGSPVAIVSGRGTAVIKNNIIINGTGNGINLFRSADVSGNIIVGRGGDGIEIAAQVANSTSMSITGNIIAACGAFGIQIASGTFLGTEDYNAFGFPNSTTNEVSTGITKGANSLTLTADPFVWSKTLTAVSWAFAGKTLTKVAGFANVHVGQSVNVTGGTGVTPGLYAIASVDSNDQITLVASIAGADTADVTTAPDFNINNHAGGGLLLRQATVVLP